MYSNHTKAVYITEKKYPISWGNVIHYLKTAAIHPQRRGEMIMRALQELLLSLPAIGTALLWPCQDRNSSWKVYYAGEHPESMRRWLAARLNPSLDATLGVLQKDLSRLTNMPLPQLICLQPAPAFPAGFESRRKGGFQLRRKATCFDTISTGWTVRRHEP